MLTIETAKAYAARIIPGAIIQHAAHDMTGGVAARAVRVVGFSGGRRFSMDVWAVKPRIGAARLYGEW